MPRASRILTVVFFALLAFLAVTSAAQAPDFPVYHRAARVLLSGEFRLYPDEVYAGHPVPSQGFRYAPIISVLFLPFGLLPVVWASVLFFATQVAAVWWMGRTVARRLAVPAWQVTSFIGAFLLTAGYLVEDLRFGNAHILCIALMVWAWDDAEEGKTVRPALTLSLAVLMKLTPLALLGWFALRGRVRLCVATVAAMVLLLVAPAAIVGPSANARELRAFRTYALEKADENDNYSVRGALVRYLTPSGVDQSHLAVAVADVPMPVVEGLSLALIALLALPAAFVVRRGRQDAVAGALGLSLVLVGMLLASPHTQRRYYIALFVPAVVLSTLMRAASQRERRLALWGLAAIVLPGTVLPLVFGGRRLALMYEATSPYLVGALVLYGVLLALAWRREPEPQRTPGFPLRDGGPEGPHYTRS